MRKGWIAAALLVLMFVGSVWNAAQLRRFTGEITSLLEQAETHAGTGDWDSVQACAAQAAEVWRAQGFYVHAVLRHDAADEVDTALREAAALARQEDAGSYAALSARLICRLRLLAESEALSLENIL